MSVEALGALRQLTQVREQAASIQNDKLEQVQQSVEQTSVSETQRMDNLNLEKVKAEYEVALSAARVERLQSQLERQEKAILYQSIGLFVSGGIALGDSISNIAKDLKGGQQFGDASQGNKAGKKDFGDDTRTLVDAGAEGSRINLYSVGNQQTYDLFKGGKLDTNNAEKLGLIQRDTEGGFTVTEDGKKFGIEVGGSGVADNQINDTASLAGVKKAAGNKDLGITDTNGNLSVRAQAVARSSLAGNGSQSFITVGFIRQDQLKGASSFEDLFKNDRAAANTLYNNTARDVKKSEVDVVSNVLGTGYKRANDPSKITGDKLSYDLATKGSKGIEDYFKGTGKIQDKKVVESIASGVISFANVVVPQFQALLKAKSDAEDTAIELKAAEEKQAAAAKKLKQIEAIIFNAGAAGDLGQALGNAN